MQAAWHKETGDLLSSLLYKMSMRLRFGFEYSTIKKGAYAPDYYAATEIEHILMRKGLLALLGGQSSIKMDVQSFPTDEKVLEAQKKQLELSIEYLEGKRSLPVTVVEKGDTKSSNAGA